MQVIIALTHSLYQTFFPLHSTNFPGNHNIFSNYFAMKFDTTRSMMIADGGIGKLFLSSRETTIRGKRLVLQSFVETGFTETHKNVLHVNN